MTVIHMTAGKEEQNTETTNLPTVIMDSSGGDESDPRFVKISSIILSNLLRRDLRTWLQSGYLLCIQFQYGTFKRRKMCDREGPRC